MENLIPIVNRLQDVFHSVGMLDTIDLPQIAVVGSQSSGKSSVLENIVGKDFLPRGVGIVTRRPLILQLIHSSDENATEYGEFLHQPQKKFTDFNEIRQEIQDETDRVTGKEGKSISALPIHLKIHSPNVLNLTLIDLPGITKVPVGNQPNDIEYQIKQMILQYIKKPNCIILAVSPANTDIANSEALKLARAVDKNGDRTVGVLTKLDLMDKGTDAMDVLQGRQIPLKLGFVGVVLRGQKDIEEGKPITEAVEHEAEYFKNHPSYKTIASKMGIPFLTRKMNGILLEHIRKCLPEIRNKISTLIAKAQQRLNEYGAPLDDGGMSQGAVLLQLLTQFTKEFNDIIDGTNAELTTDDLFGGARINNIFNSKFVPLLNSMDACEGLSDYDIRTSIRNAKGPRSSLFIPESAFVMLVKRQVKKLEDPSLRCVSQVFEELVVIVDHAEKHFIRFPKLREQAREFVIDLLRRYEAPLKLFIKNLIQIEMAHINTNHPDFFDGGNASHLILQQNQSQQQQQQSLQHPPQMNGGGMKPPLPSRSGQTMPQRIEDANEDKGRLEEESSPYTSEDSDGGEWVKVDSSATHTTHDSHTKGKTMRKKAKSRIFKLFFGRSDPTEEEEEASAENVDPEVDTQQLQYPQPQSTSDRLDRKSNRVNMDNSSNYKSKQDYQDYGVDLSSEGDSMFSSLDGEIGNMSVNTNYSLQDPYSYAPPQSNYQDEVSERDQRESQIIKTLLREYFNIVRKNVADAVPKAIIHFLVNMTKSNLQSEFVQNLYKSELFDELLQENEEIAQKRKATQKMLTILLRAQDILTEVRDMKV